MVTSMDSVNDRLRNLSLGEGTEAPTDAEIVALIKQEEGDAFSGKRLEKKLRERKDYRCLECGARYPSLVKLNGHINTSKHQVGRKIKENIRTWITEIGLDPDKRTLISITDEELVELGFPEREYRDTRDEFLLKNRCHVHWSEKSNNI